jgi:hypothetical protein
MIMESNLILSQLARLLRKLNKGKKLQRSPVICFEKKTFLRDRKMSQVTWKIMGNMTKQCSCSVARDRMTWTVD